MKLALAQINTTVGDFRGNVAKIRECARRAQQGGAELVIFPELAVCGYPPRDLVERPAFVERNLAELECLARETTGLQVVCGFVGRPEGQDGRPTNCAAWLAGGRVAFVQKKMLLPNYDVFDEARHFTPAARQELFPLCGRRVALTICEDVWNDKHFWKKRLYERDPVEELVRAGGDFLINIAASPYHHGKRELRRKMLRALALQYRIPVVSVNLVGGNDSLVFDGSSCVLDTAGELRAATAPFQEDLVFYDTAANQGDIHTDIAEETEAVYQTLVLGTRDYVRKCGFSRVLVGLSGGIDSSLTAVLALEALGAENVTGVAMPGPYSSPGSLEDARALAERLGIRLHVISITAIFQSFRESLAQPFASLPEDVTEENLQARIRGTILMALSNKFRALVLSTGNKSELAVGYATLYGDMAGGLAVLADIPKTMVYELARLANRRLREPISESVFTKPPSAELRPDQKDTDSLPPYEVLDPVLKAYIEEFQSPAEIAGQLGLPLEQVREICLRVDRNEYKRQQAAPGLKVTSKAFGVGRRFPIAQKPLED